MLRNTVFSNKSQYLAITNYCYFIDLCLNLINVDYKLLTGEFIFMFGLLKNS